MSESPGGIANHRSTRKEKVWWLVSRSLGREIAMTLALIATLLLLLSVLLNSGLGGKQAVGGFLTRTWQFISHAHLDRNGQPIGPQFLFVCRETLPLVVAASVWLVTLSLISGTLIAVQPRLQTVRWGILALSCMPSFMGPLLGFLISPARPFAGFDQIAVWGWPALCLAVGDLNWLTGTTVVSEAVRQELGRPHWRLSRVLGTPIVWDLAPRLIVTTLGFLAARLPHLLGGTIALEALFRIHGIGLWTWNAIVESPPDPTVLLWVGGLGIVLSRAMQTLTTVATLVCFPDQREKPQDVVDIELEPEQVRQTGTLVRRIESDGQEYPSYENAESEFASDVSPITTEVDDVAVRLAVSWQVAAAVAVAVPARPTVWQGLRVRWRYYEDLHPTHRLKRTLAGGVVFAWALLMLLLASHALSVERNANRVLAGAFEAPSWRLLFGTNAAGDDVAWLLWKGWWQQLPAWCGCVLMLWLAVPLSLTGLARVAGQTHWWGRALFGVRLAADWLMSVLEATPKLMWLLACFTVFTLDGMVLKLALAMGVLFVPQLDRVLRAELAVVRSSVFLEAMRMARVPWWRVLWENVLAGHVWPALCVQTALILSNVVLTESWLGYLGVRNRGEIFTWGSSLGMGVDEFVQMRPLVAFGQPFNDGVVWGPLVCLWLTICLLTTIGHGLKVLTGSYLWRLK